MRFVYSAIVAVLIGSASAQAQLLDALTAPVTLIERAVEARSTSDIVKDNEIVVKVNAIMGKVESIKASTEIYEQRLLITGLFDNKADYDSFDSQVRQVAGVKKLYWHVSYLAKDDPKRKSLLGWDDVLEMTTKAKARLVGTKGVADVNFRITGDSTGTLYLLGRARSGEEKQKALARVKDGKGVTKVVDYVVVKP
jgi:hyperosmotically inducible protein